MRSYDNSVYTNIGPLLRKTADLSFEPNMV